MDDPDFGTGDDNDLLSAALSASGLDEFLSFSLPESNHDSDILNTVDQDIRQSQPIMMDPSCISTPVTTTESYLPVSTRSLELQQSTIGPRYSLSRSESSGSLASIPTSSASLTGSFPAGTRLARIGDKTVAIKPHQRLIVFRRGGGATGGRPRMQWSAPASQSTSPAGSGRSSPASTSSVTVVTTAPPGRGRGGRIPQAPRLVRGSSPALISGPGGVQRLVNRVPPLIQTNVNELHLNLIKTKTKAVEGRLFTRPVPLPYKVHNQTYKDIKDAVEQARRNIVSAPGFRTSQLTTTRGRMTAPTAQLIRRPRLESIRANVIGGDPPPPRTAQQARRGFADPLSQHDYGQKMPPAPTFSRANSMSIAVNPKIVVSASSVSPSVSYAGKPLLGVHNNNKKPPIPSGTTVRVTKTETGTNSIRIVTSPDQSVVRLTQMSPDTPPSSPAFPTGSQSRLSNISPLQQQQPQHQHVTKIDMSPSSRGVGRDPLKPAPKLSMRTPYTLVAPSSAAIALRKGLNTDPAPFFRSHAPVRLASALNTGNSIGASPAPPQTSISNNNPIRVDMGESKAPMFRANTEPSTSKSNSSSSSVNSANDEEMNDDEEAKLGHADTYAEYVPAKLRSGQPHPDSVVETSSLNSVAPPDIRYHVSIPDEVIDSGYISALQLESVIYACQQHECTLPSGERAGFLVGDGAGVGKGRIIASIIHENYLVGRKRAIWFSVSNDLKFDSERDLQDVGAGRIKVHPLNKFKYAKISGKENGSVKRGVLFATYASLIGECRSARGKYKTRLKQLLQWCGPQFDGVIVFDECHRAKNLMPSVGGKASKTGQAVLELQKCLPRARIVYASATGATEPRNMAYMTRLGLWGLGQPFPEFSDFLNAVEKRGVGAMEIVAIDMKQRGSYLARQLSFKGVSFRVEPVSLSDDFVRLYDQSAKLWLEVRRQFQAAIELADVDRSQNKAIWSQFWASHQRFFKYLCIGAKVAACVKLAREAIKNGKCVIIGLQSTGEARTLEQLEDNGGELSEFVSTTKAVLMSLVDKHFPTGKRDNGLFSADIFATMDEMGFGQAGASGGIKRKLSSTAHTTTGKRARIGDNQQSDTDSADSDGGNEKQSEQDESDSDGNDSDDDEADNSDTTTDSDDEQQNNDESKKNEDWYSKLFAEAQSSDESEDSDQEEDKDVKEEQVKDEEDDFNPFDEDGEDYWASKQQVAQPSPEKPSTSKAKPKKKRKAKSTSSSKKSVVPSTGGHVQRMAVDDFLGQHDTQDHEDALACGKGGELALNKIAVMKAELMASIERLGQDLPANTLDQLIDELGGASKVAEMTGRRGRVVCSDDGEVRYEPRQLGDVSLELLNLAEKERFMNGEKLIAIISEAASSGISLQADRRASNQRRRVHITLELPWSADKAIQQFGRSHRSNQVNAPEYVFLISELAGEQRFASIVAKRLESLGALTHGDRRATETRDLSQFNLDTKYGRAALESLIQTIIGKAAPIVPTPVSYHVGEFLPDMRRYLDGVGVLTCDKRGVYSPDKDANNIAKFLNRLLGLPVAVQNSLFQYFLDTLNELVNQAKRDGRYDLGILDLGMSGDRVHRSETRVFIGSGAGTAGQYQVELHTIQVERGMSWKEALDTSKAHVGTHDGFYFTHAMNNRPSVALICGTGKKHLETGARLFSVTRPNTGRNARLETLADLVKRFKAVSIDAAMPVWQRQFEASATHCQHMSVYGSCRSEKLGITCDIGKRTRYYHIMSGNVLSVWPTVESVLSATAGKRHSRMQVIRAKTDTDAKIVGLVIPSRSMTALTNKLAENTFRNYTT